MTEENPKQRGSNRPSYERKMLPSLPLNNSSVNHRIQLQSDIDFSLLDYKSVDDFLYYTKSKSEFQDLSKHLAKQLKASRSLLSLSRFLTVGSSPREVINKIVESASAIIDAERVIFMEFDQDSGDLVYLKSLDNSDSFRARDGIECESLSLASSQIFFLDEVATTSHSILVNDVDVETKCNSSLYSHLRIHPRNIVCVPVIFSDKTSGVLLALNKLAPELYFTQFDVSCLQSIAGNLAILLRQASLSLGQIDIRISRSPSSLQTEDREDKDILSTKSFPPRLSDLSEVIVPDLDSKTTHSLSSLVQEAGHVLRAERMSLFLPQTSSKLKCVVSQDILGLEIPVTKGIVGDTFTSQRHFSILDVKTDPRHYSEVDRLSKNETNSLLSYPILINGNSHQPYHASRVAGVLQAINKRDGPGFTEEDGQYMSELCIRVAAILAQNTVTPSGASFNTKALPTSQGDIMRPLSEFASLLNRMEEKNYLQNLFSGLTCYGTAISDCDEILVFSILTRPQSEGNSLEIQPLTLSNTPPSPVTSTIVSSKSHSSAILETLKKREPHKLILPLTLEEIEHIGAPHLNLLVLPVTYTSNPQLASRLAGRSIDVILAVKYQGIQPGVFTPSQVEGLTALTRLLSPSLTLYAQILHEEAALEQLQSNQLLMSSTLSRLGLMVFVVSSTGEVVMHTNSWQKFLGVDESEMKSHTLNELLGDRSPGFMSDIKECIRSHSPREAKNVRIFSASFPKGVSVNYDIHEYRNPYAAPQESSGTHSLFRVILTVLSGGDFTCDETVVSETFLPSQDLESSEKSAPKIHESKFSMKSSPDARALRSPRQFSPSDAAEVERLFTWEFNVLSIVDPAARRYCVVAVLEKDLNLGMLNISRNQLAAFVAEVEKNYRLNPFHNFFHAVCVTHFISMLMRETQARIHINNDLMYFSMMTSAVVHDVDHPGNTNLFEINSCSELALLYNDIGVLENHHCATAFRIMRLPGLDIFGQLNFAQKSLARKTIISCIMATDMALHVGLVEQMAARTGQPWLIDTPTEKLFYGKIILHSADLSNPVRPFYLSKEWACRVSEEFNRQGEMEKSRGLPVSTFLLTPDTKTLAKNEIFFSGQVVAPMWRSLASLFPTLQHLATQIESNVESWKELLASLE
jgi:GAF domain-containing protein